MSRPTPRPRPLRRARAAASLGAVGLLAVPLIGSSNAVAVTVDGEELTARTYAATVGDVLDQLEVPLGPADAVSPAPGASVVDGTEIAVARAITVEVVVDGQLTRRITAPVGSVAGVLALADLGDVRSRGAALTPAWTSPVADGDTIHVTLPTPVQLVVDGGTRHVETLATTVAGLLAEQDVDLDAEDTVDWDLDAPVHPHTTVTVERVAYDEVVEEVVLERDEVRRETDDLRRGVTRVEDEGRDGLRRDTYRVRTVDGEEVDRERVDREVVREPRDRVVLVGTHVPPPPEPAPAPSSSSSGSGSSGSGSGSNGGVPSDVWDQLARCESGGNWQSRGGTYHGGLQFHPSTWNAHKPSGYPEFAYEATREQQITVGQRVQRAQGWAAWPHCSQVIGLR
ncbi:DUF348 domain-containing protein [Nitriliruptoraceae bacterium ZYF776]|nr:DUF348 domain-containing protein [Profundirhabdus halotolerans]